MRVVSDYWKQLQNNKIVPKNFLKATFDSTPFLSSTVTGNNDTSQSDLTYFDAYKIRGDNLSSAGKTGAFISNATANASGTFSTNPTLTISYTSPVFEYSTPKIRIRWDVINGRYPIKFNVSIHGQDGQEFWQTYDETVSVTDNASAISDIVFFQTYGLLSIKIEIIEWNTPNVKAVIDNVFPFGTDIVEYDNSRVLSMSLKQSISVLSATIPSDKLTLEMNNIDNIFNSDSDYYSQRILVETGYKNENNVTEWIQLGEFFINSFDLSEDGLSCTFVADNVLSTFVNVSFLLGNVSSNNTLNPTYKQLAATILQDAVLRNTPYGKIRYDVSNVPDILTNGIIPKATRAEALQLISQVCNMILICNHEGILTFQSPEQPVSDYLIDSFHSYDYPKLEKIKNVGDVSLSLYTNTNSEGGEEILVENGSLWAYRTYAYLEFAKPVFDLSTVRLEDSGYNPGVAQLYAVYNNGCIVIRRGSDDGSTEFRIYGVPTNQTVVNDSNFQSNPQSTREVFEINNPLITPFATDTYLYKQFIQLWSSRAKLKIECRLDPRVCTGDIITVRDKKRNTYTIIVTAIDIDYNGAYRGVIEGIVISAVNPAQLPITVYCTSEAQFAIDGQLVSPIGVSPYAVSAG